MTNFDYKPSPEEGHLLTDNRALVHCVEVENHNGGIPYGQVEATGTSFVAITGDTLDSSTINQEMNQIVWHYEKDAPVDLDFLYCREGVSIELALEELRPRLRKAARSLGIISILSYQTQGKALESHSYYPK